MALGIILMSIFLAIGNAIGEKRYHPYNGYYNDGPFILFLMIVLIIDILGFLSRFFR